MPPAPEHESYQFPKFKRGQRVIVVKSIYRNHDRLDHLLGQKVTITGRFWDRGVFSYTIRTKTGHRIRGLRHVDFEALHK